MFNIEGLNMYVLNQKTLTSFSYHNDLSWNKLVRIFPYLYTSLKKGEYYVQCLCVYPSMLNFFSVLRFFLILVIIFFILCTEINHTWVTRMYCVFRAVKIIKLKNIIQVIELPFDLYKKKSNDLGLIGDRTGLFSAIK